MKFILVVVLVTGNWFNEKATVGQVGPFDSLLACEAARRQMEPVAQDIAREVGMFCASTKDPSFRIKGGK